LLTLLERRATGSWPAELLLLARQSLLALSSLSGSALWPGSALLTLLDLLLLLARQTLLPRTTLLATLFRLSLSALRLALTALRSAGLTLLLLLALVLGILTLGNDEAAVDSTRAVKRDAQLRNRDRRHQGAGEQNVAKLLQLPDGFEWQVPLLKCDDKAHQSMRGLPPRLRHV